MKYKLTDDSIVHNEVTLYRTVALKDFDDIKCGEIGGYVESEDNLSQGGNCWVFCDAKYLVMLLYMVMLRWRVMLKSMGSFKYTETRGWVPI